MTENGIQVWKTPILTALKKRPLTIENISYALDLKLKIARDIIEKLWEDDYIDTIVDAGDSAIGSISGGMIVIVIASAVVVPVIPILAIGAFVAILAIGAFVAGASLRRMLNSRKFLAKETTRKQEKFSEFSNSKTYFTLTSKGYLFLHPANSR